MNFWRLFCAGFTFVFPIFFVYVGFWPTSAMVSTISLVLGIVLWSIFALIEFRNFVLKPARADAYYRRIYNSSPNSYATVESISNVGTSSKPKYKYLLKFQNLSGTTVHFSIENKKDLSLMAGQSLPIYINTDEVNPDPPFVVADNRFSFKPSFNPASGLFYVLFIIAYAVGFFLACYALFSNGYGWRFMSPWHPWVWAPIIGIFTTKVIGGVDKYITTSGTNQKLFNKLVTRGLKAEGTIISREHTGTTIMNSPLMKFIVQYSDKQGIQHQAVIKELIAFNDIYKFELNKRPVLYLKDDPSIAKFEYIERSMTEFAHTEPSDASYIMFDNMISD
ncbi:hypothetical protein [Taylorella equigenitalis]|uniref:Transmembrane protein n=1 Tax=Taylorella equigenitalis (strain MCE9) TaxID=937774 RepID=A0A654KJ07_TAYEM|nr:hypothetical protein [Taylorella equigenitalis]ADU92385.1 hypothetical protein TEQUI_1472 [Taylorella equigenitalis MCE9]WDU51184.1 hypothetical protein KNO32_04185 [Taylorella equigenitalis]WDU55674.1 hypothetical protein KPH58_04145 [Taylorella equigenitalis]WED99778.1 hypothetical protein PZB79_04150 [Taylorella equigenitalis]WEE01256.1 hypothetical protein PZB80_04155 [Taylorella equigenitalis]